MNSNQDDVLKLYDDVIAKMVLDWRYQARVDDTVYGFLVALYACMIIVGATGNLLVIFVVIRNRAMRTARNVFIVNLAISDLMLCLITMPLTLVEILYMTWQFGDYPAACPVAASLQATSIFVSTLSITAIALDRRKLIVCPHEPPPSGTLIMATVPIIWASAFAMASPLAIWKKLERWSEPPDDHLMTALSGGNATDANCTEILLINDYSDEATINCKITEEIFPKWLSELQSCGEYFPPYVRLVYSCLSMAIQYLLPTITISIAYFQIYGQLKVRLDQKMRQLTLNASNGGPAKRTATQTNVIDRIENDMNRMKRTIHLLISVGLVFCVCWLPLNINNLVMDITEKSRKYKGKSESGEKDSEQTTYIIYAICHVAGMLSACANPIIYGFLNENFKAEFKELYSILKKKLSCCSNCNNNTTSENNHEDNILAEEHQSQPFLNTTNGGRCVTIESKKIAEKCESNQAIHV